MIESRDAARMKSDLDTKINHTLKKLEGLSMECNQALTRLKLGTKLQYQLNAKGTTPSEVLGIDYKVELMPALESFVNDVKLRSLDWMEELITLQRKSVELSCRIEEKQNRIASLEKAEHKLTSIKKEIEEHISGCEVEKRRVVQDFEAEIQNLETAETEAANMLEAANINLQNTINQTKEETQKCAFELFKLVDGVSKYKEHATSKITEMKDNLSQTASNVSDVYKCSLPF